MNYDNISDSDDELLGKDNVNISTINNKHQYVKSKYLKMNDINGIVGFIVNIYDGINFDIDLHIPKDMINNYSTVITDNYTYKNLSCEYFINGDLDSNNFEGIVYRCHLRGIGINKNTNNIHKVNLLTNYVKKIIDKSDGWVICNISDIDVYNRLLVDIIIPESMNDLKHLILKTQDYFDPVYKEYLKY